MTMKLTPNDPVENAEILFRSVTVNQGYTYESGIVRFSSSAFNDRNNEPSVNRAQFATPEESRLSTTDGIAKLIARDVRNCSVGCGAYGEIIYELDILEDPITTPPPNQAHAKIIPAPSYKNKTHFKKVKERLAFLATEHGWVIKP